MYKRTPSGSLTEPAHLRRSIYHPGPQTGRRPRRATRELDPSDDHRQTFDQREARKAHTFKRPCPTCYAEIGDPCITRREA